MKLIRLSSTEITKMGFLQLLYICAIVVGVVFLGIVFLYSTGYKHQVNQPSGNAVSSNPVVDKDRSFPDGKMLSGEGARIDGSPRIDKKARSVPDPLLHGMSLQELDVFHKRQMVEIAQKVLDPRSAVELPPSDDPHPTMTLEELNAFHRQQQLEIQSQSREFEQVVFPPSDDGGLQITLQELEAMHKEQAIQSQAADEVVKLPSVMAENEVPALTIDELTYLQEDQQFEAQIREVNDTEPIVLPPSTDGQHSITNWELIELHLKQDQLIRQRYGR